MQKMASTDPPPVPWLTEPLLARGCVSMLAGREGTGKSMLALALAAAVGHGRPLAGLTCKSGSTVYIDAENGEREAHRRIRGLGVAPDGLTYIEANGFNLQLHAAMLAEVVEAEKPDLLILDSFRSMAPGMDENDSGSTERSLRPVVKLAQSRGIAVLLLHHASRGGEYRGSTAIGAAVELGFTLARHPDDPEGRTRRRLHCWKSRPAAEPEETWLSLATGEHGVEIDVAEPFHAKGAARADAGDALIHALPDGPTTFAAWARDAGLDPKSGTARRARDELFKRGAIEKQGDLWKATDNVIHGPWDEPA